MFMTTVEKENENNVAIDMIQLCVLGFHNCIFVHRDIFEVKWNANCELFIISEGI